MRKLIAANWKMNKGGKDSIDLINDLKELVKSKKNCDILVCPPFTALYAIHYAVKNTNIMLGAQNMHFEDSGAFTGDISLPMLKEAGCSYVILGHSERREFFHEDDMLINKKLAAAIKGGIKPILCVGETLEQRERNWTQQVLEKQLSNCLHGIARENVRDVTIAYEPVWAISRGNSNVKAATPNDAKTAHDFIRHVIADKFGHEISDSIRILYGGSMKPENARELLSIEGVDGGLVGNASLNAKSFAEIVNAAD